MRRALCPEVIIMVNVRVFTTQSCPYCVMAKEFLKKNRIKFKEIDVSDEEGREEVIRLSGQRGVPVIEIDGKIVIGFDKPALRRLLHTK